MSFKLKRIYDPPAGNDGVRILVDRLWPRGVSKERAQLAEWCRDLAPSHELRKTLHADQAGWEDVCKAYAAELDRMPEEVSRLRELARNKTVTLLFAAKNEEQNNAVALKSYLESDPH